MESCLNIKSTIKINKKRKMETGKIKFWNRTKAFGFIIDNNTSEEVFVHISGLKDRTYEPNQDEEVTYEIKEGKRGPNAVNVELA